MPPYSAARRRSKTCRHGRVGGHLHDAGVAVRGEGRLRSREHTGHAPHANVAEGALVEARALMPRVLLGEETPVVVHAGELHHHVRGCVEPQPRGGTTLSVSPTGRIAS